MTPPDPLLLRVRHATRGAYTIERELGRGGMAAVFLGTDLALHRRVAIKVMLPELATVAGLQDRFVSEARTAANLDHPGIVTIHAVREGEGLTFIVMRFIDGRTLDTVLKHEPSIPLVVVETLVAEIAEALHHAHLDGIVHRDVKPSNIILDRRGRPCVTDFGIARVTTAPSTTVSGAFVGTPAYMSPEQCRGVVATAASDQYGLGVMAYEMIARRRPFSGTMFELIHAHVHDPVPRLETLVPDVDPATAEMVHRMLAKDPADRFASLAEVSERFRALAESRGERSAVSSAIVALARGREGEHAEYATLPFTSDSGGAEAEGGGGAPVGTAMRAWVRPLVALTLVGTVGLGGWLWSKSRSGPSLEPPTIAATLPESGARIASPPAADVAPRTASAPSTATVPGGRGAGAPPSTESSSGGRGAPASGMPSAVPLQMPQPPSGGSDSARGAAGVSKPDAGRANLERAAPPPVSPPAPAASPVGEAPTTAAPSRAAETRLSCGPAGAAELAVLQALGGALPQAFDVMYHPVDPADAKLKAATLEQLRAGSNHRASVSAVRGEEMADGCAWTMRLRISYTNAFHQDRERQLTVRAQLRTENGRVVVKQLTGAGGA